MTIPPPIGRNIILQKKRPFIKRLDSQPKPALPLTDVQAEGVSRVLRHLEDDRYSETPNSCICGSNDDILIAERDRYGIPIETVLCRGCGLLRSDPYLTPQSIIRFYQEDYRSIYTSVDGTKGLFANEYLKGSLIHGWLIKHSAAIPPLVFEIGCGAGGILQYFQGIGSSVAGCDYGEDGCAFGRASGLRLETGGSDKLAKYGRADLLILCHVLEHWRDLLNELKRLHNLLRENGLVYIELPGIFDIRRTYRDIALFLQNAHVWHFCLVTLDYVMSLAGFERLAGNERIQSLYRVAPKCASVPRNPDIHRRILYSLLWTERLRYLPRSMDVLDWFKMRGRKILGDARYAAVKSTIRSARKV